MLNPLRRNRVYLRNKSALMRDYMMGVSMALGIGLFVQFQYRKINPVDPMEIEEQGIFLFIYIIVGAVTHPINFAFESISK